MLTILTHELIEELTEVIKAGNYVKTACDYMGLYEQTFYRWIKEGEKISKTVGDFKGEDAKNEYIEGLNNNEKLYYELYESIKRAKGKAIVRNVMVIQKASQKSWQAAAWWLERTNHKDWGRKDFIDMNANMNHNISDETVERWRKKLEDRINRKDED